MNAAYSYLNHELIPYAHQVDYLQRHSDKEFWALFWETGSAKTLPIIATAADKYLRGEIDLLVVFAPNNVHSNWVRREIPKTLDVNFPWAGYIWRNEHTVKAQKEREAFLKLRGKLKVLTINFEAISAHKTMQTNKGIIFLAQLMKAHKGRCMGVIDEADAIGDPRTLRAKRILKFGPYFKYRRIATGTPNTESPFQLFTQSEFLKPGILGYDSYDTFEITHGVFKLQKFNKDREDSRKFRKCVGYRGMGILREKIKAFSSSVRKVDCLDLPEKLYSVRNVELTKEQKTAYAQMRELLLHEVKTEDGPMEYAVAKNVLHKIRKLHEIVIGFSRVEVPYVGDPEEAPKKPVYKIVPMRTNRPDVLMEILPTLTGKALIFTDCIPALEQIVDRLRTEYGDDAVGACYGKIKGIQRDETIDTFEDKSSPMKYLVANQKTGGVGLTLIAAQTVIFYSNGYSLRLRKQAEDRAHRGGQTNKVLYIDIIAEGTVDEKVLDAFRDKVDVASQVIHLFDVFLGERVLTVEERAKVAAMQSEMQLDLYSELLGDGSS